MNCLPLGPNATMYWLFWSFPSRSSTLEMVLASVLIEDMELVIRIVAEAETMAHEVVSHLFSRGHDPI